MQGDGRESALASRDPPTQNEDEELQKAATAIYDVANACFDVLERLVSAVDADSSPEQALLTSDSASADESPYDIRGLRNSFAFWIDYTGALASAGASLDDRLHGHDEIKEMVVELLEMIERNLRRLEQKRDENTPFPNAESQRWLSAIDSAIDRLHFLASAIRKASARRKEQDIFNFVSDEDKFFRSMAISYVKWKCPNARPSLREHMGDSIAERRQALLQRHRHAKKLKTRRVPKPPSALKYNQSFASSVEKSAAEPAVGDISCISASAVGSKATQASEMDRKVAMQHIYHKPALSIRSSGSSQQGDSISAEYPDPPRIKPGEKHVQCPYCLEPLPAAKMRDDTKNKYWRRHVDQDLQPYVCLYQRCTNSLFAHQSAWSKHMATAHSQEWPRKAHSMTWYCDLGHAEPAMFDNETHWRKHMRELSLHPGRSKPPTDAQLDALSAGKQKLAPRDPYACLFCEEKPQRIAILGDRGNSTDMASILVDHIAEHVKSLSFLSLPGLEGAAAEDDGRSANLENTSRKRLRNPGSPPQPASGVEFVEDISLIFDDDGKAGSQSHKKLVQLDQIDHEYVAKQSEQDVNSSTENKVDRFFTYIPSVESDFSWDFIPRYAVPLSATDSAFKQWHQLSTPCAKGIQLSGQWNLNIQDNVSITNNPVRTNNDRARDCQRALFVTDPFEDRKQLERRKGGRARGTCEWIFGTEELTVWLGSGPTTGEGQAAHILWLYGNPGTGKSTMAIFLTEELSTAFFAKGGKTLAYFFCDSGFENQKTATSVIRGLLLQLVQQLPQLLDYLLPKYNERGEGLFKSFDALWAIFMDVAADPNTGRKYCIIDALDECDRESQDILLRQLHETFQSRNAPPNIRILVTSRPYPEIREYLEEFVNKDLASFPETKQDINRCIEERMADLAKRKHYSNRVKRQVGDILRDKAKGTFLWVGLACNELEHIPSKDAVLFLQGMPKGLHSLYRRLLNTALEQSDPASEVQVQRILSFVAVCLRPLSLLELSEACQLHMDEEDIEIRLQSVREEIALCRLMITIQDEKVHLLHPSLKDFLVGAGAGQFINVLEAHAHLAYRCVDHLIKQYYDRKQSHISFSEYATRHWANHARIAQSSFEIQASQAEFFEINSLCREYWLRIYRRLHAVSERISEEFSILHVAARWGVPALAENVSHPNGRHRNPGEVSRLVNCVDASGVTPLQCAARSEYPNVVPVLLNMGGKVTAQVTQAAAGNWNHGMEVMMLLLDRQGDEITITEEVVKAAAGNSGNGMAVMALLLDRRGDEITITEEVVKAAAGNSGNGMAVMALLLDRRGDEITITEEVVKAAAGNSGNGREVMALLLDRGVHIETETDISRLTRRDESENDNDSEFALHKYTIGWICAIATEYLAAQLFLDEEHEGPEFVSASDSNNYTLGKIGKHNVVIAVLPHGEYGISSAAGVAKDMLRSFPNVRFGLMVGIGGGAPTPEHDIRLGDVVVSASGHGKGGVFQYDFGKAVQGQEFQETGFLNQPPTILRTAVHELLTQYKRKGHQLDKHIDDILKENPRLKKEFQRPESSTDRLYHSTMVHPPDDQSSCAKACGDDPLTLVLRPDRTEYEDNPAIHYGLIASSNRLMKDALTRDALAAKKGVLCFEMEAAGLMNHFPCLVIRGICDYSDSHKNKEWQGFAAMMAAAYAKDLLYQIPPNKVEAEKPISEILTSIESTGNKTKHTVISMASNHHFAKIKRWLSPPDYSTNANLARERRHPGTGAWLLNSPAFQEWKLGSRQHLWLYGLAGCGKTILSTTILDHLLQTDTQTTLAFFFDFNDPRKQKLEDLLRSLAVQLYHTGNEAARSLDSLFASHDDGRRQPDTTALSTCVDAMIQNAGIVFIVIDALDECTTREELLQWLKHLVFRKAQLIVTGRPEVEFQSAIPRSFGKQNCVQLDKNVINVDIRSYVEATLEQKPDFVDKKLSPSILEEIRDKIGDGADGMFRWAACQLESLARCQSPKAIKIALRSLPRDLQETYYRMLQNIPSEYKSNAIRLLQFLVYTKRPLTLAEAIEVIATEIDQEHRGFSVDGRTSQKADILRYCPSLVIIAKVTKYAETVEELHLAHYSIRDYLLLQTQFDLESASIAITKTCLTYLTDINGSHSTIRRDFPMARYAAETWVDYAIWAGASEDVIRTTISFLQDEATFQRWCRLYQADYAWEEDPGPPRASRLYYACLGGLAKAAKALVEDADIDAEGGRYGNALQAASFQGNLEVVQLLLDKGADVTTQGGEYGNALQAASSKGNLEVVQLLLDKGADVNAQGGKYGNALQAASSKGNLEVVQLLLDKGADVNAQGGKYGNALQAASSKGNLEVVQLLLDKGADVTTQGGEYGNALQAASSKGNLEVVQLLLDKGADVNAQGGKYGNALQAASSKGNLEVVQLLLDKGADVNAQGGKYGNALYAASYEGYQEVVQLLLDRGADSNAMAASIAMSLATFAS
ncbi:hypothetical protein DER44DRAFT_739024 [Fusarium oxysporum]|nr:hypothetical protein DER44DRAFT_739024 [Fusarium oxysporum]